jgi:uroporphyrinogen-III synthase
VRVVVTRERGHNQELVSWLPHDALVSEVPLTTTRYFESHEVRETLHASEYFGHFRALVVTSARSALYVALAREALAPGGSVLSVGTATARAIESEDIEVDIVGDTGVVDLDTEVAEGPVLLLGAAGMREELATSLAKRRVVVEKLICYETVPAVLTPDEEIELQEADVVFVGAPSAWLVARNYLDPHTWIVVPGSTTASVVTRHHERVIVGWSPALKDRLLAL